MSDIQLYLLEVEKNKDEAGRIAVSCAHKLETKQLRLLDLVTSLQEYINNKNDGVQRANSISFLAEVLTALPAKVLSGHERRLLFDFIIGRWESDLEGTGASAQALMALESLGRWDSDAAQRTMKTLVEHVNPLRQFKVQTDRYAVIQLIDMILAKNRSAVHDLHKDEPDFMPRLISLFEGEKDPRNLMVVFSVLQVPMTEWDVAPCAQDLFESVFNYFPITFRPPPDDPYGITAQDLKDRLRACIASNGDFAPYAFPQLLDKLDSTSMNTKRDVLHALQACIINYEPQTINLYAVTLWDALKFEVLNVQEEDLAEGALQALALTAAKFVQNHPGPLAAFLKPIIKECNEHIEDAPTKQSQASGCILRALIAVSPVVAERIVKGVLPTLFALYQASESTTKRRGLLEIFNEILKAHADLQQDSPDYRSDALPEFSEDALKLMLRALSSAPKSEVSFRLASLDGLVQLLRVDHALADVSKYLAVDAVTEIALRERVDGHGDIRMQAIKSLTAIAGVAPDAIRDRCIPAFMAELSDTPPDTSAYIPLLEAFAELSAERQVFDTVVLRLKNKFNIAHNANASHEYQRALLLALLYAFTHGSPAKEYECIRSDYYREYAQPFVDLLKSSKGDQGVGFAMDTIGRICNVILRPQGVHFQSTVYREDSEWLSTLIQQDTATIMAPFLIHYFAAMRREVVDPVNVVHLLQARAKHDLSAASVQDSCLRLISLLLNKFIEPAEMKTTLQTCGLEVDALLEQQTSASAVAIGFVVMKALLVQGRNAKLSNQYMDCLLARLHDTSDELVAPYFVTLLAPDDILTRENHCLISPLYKQRLFSQAVPRIIEMVRTRSDAAQKASPLRALSGILRWLPYSILESSLPSLTAPLLQTLDLATSARDQRDVKSSSLTLFESMLMHNPDLLAEHTASLVTRLLNSTATGAGGPVVRAKALQCLSLVPRQLKREAVIPYRRQVVQRLVACLDDPKRNVRAEAVRCRKAWLALDEGGDDDE